ncbi:radical SAM protein, partial [Vicingaceae bacterium]|nr:radical SAM protein [Vicingaceae bacterium]
LSRRMLEIQPKLVCLSVPFPGNLFSAFRCAQYLKKNHPTIKIAMGGGFPNTELRSLTDVRVFDYFDFITLDDGELPIELLHKYVSNQQSDSENLKRTYLKQDNKVFYSNNTKLSDYKQSELGTPDYSDLKLDEYISVIEIANPMHSLWSDGRWNKLTMAHGCYWGKCSFCDVSLDYIKLYEPVTAKIIVDRIEELIEKTGERGFHFVDEAAPPALMREIALEILRRKLVVTWWANIRFEKSFTSSLAKLLSTSGCIAVSGGLEVASDRLLKLIDKGVTVEQVAKVTRNLTEEGIMVHAYLMYGYPTQTIQETINSLEMVRQLFEAGVLKSGFWHQFALTAHSPIGLNPEAYGITPHVNEITFANNDVEFTDKTGIDHNQFSEGLRKSLYNYMHGIGFELPLKEWFDFKIPPPTIARNYIQSSLQQNENWKIKPTSKVCWIESLPTVEQVTRTKKGKTFKNIELTFDQKKESFTLQLEPNLGKWLAETLSQLSIYTPLVCTYEQLKADYEQHFENFELFWYSKSFETLKCSGIITY